MAYQGFNDGTVYPGKRGENYIYEGLVLRLLKSDWDYQMRPMLLAITHKASCGRRSCRPS